MINIKKEENLVNTIIFSDVKTLSLTNEINAIRNTLKSEVLNDKDAAKLFYLLGRLHVKNEDVEAAKRCFNTAVVYDDTNKKALALVLKYNIIDNNYEEARRNAQYLKSLAKETDINYECNIMSLEIINKLYDIINSISIYLIDKNNISLNCSINSDIYKELIEYINDLDIKNAIKVIDVNSSKIYLSGQMKLLLTKIISLKNEKNTEIIIQTNNKLLQENKYEDITNNLLNTNNRNQEIIDYTIFCCKTFIDSKQFKCAKQLISSLKNKGVSTNLLERKLNSCMHHNSMSKDRYNDITMILHNANTEILYGNYNNALNYLFIGLDNTNENIFNYYIGKLYFKGFKDFKKAEKYFKEYEKTGYGKLSKCEFYLTNIAIKNNGKYNKSYKKYKDAVDFVYETENKKIKKCTKYLDEAISRKKFKMKENRYSKWNAKYIDMNENDFIKGNSKTKTSKN